MNFNEFKTVVQRKFELENFLKLNLLQLYRRYGKLNLNVDESPLIKLEQEHKYLCKQIYDYKSTLAKKLGPLNPQAPDTRWVERKPERQWYEFSFFDVLKYLDSYLEQNNCEKSYDIYNIDRQGTRYENLCVTSYHQIDVNFKNKSVESSITFLIPNLDFFNMKEFPSATYENAESVIKYFTDRLVEKDKVYFDTYLSKNKFNVRCLEYPVLPDIFTEGKALPKENSLFFRGIREIPWQIMEENINFLFEKNIRQEQGKLRELNESFSELNPKIKAQKETIKKLADLKSNFISTEIQLTR